MSNNKKGKRIYLSSPHMGGTEPALVQDVFDSNWVAPLGPMVDGFENDLASFVNVKYAAALSSGTAAIHLALIMLGVQPGDLVICQSLTFSATANPIRYLNAIPVFVDSESDTWNMCPIALEEAINECLNGNLSAKGSVNYGNRKPKAILPVHLYGMPAKMDQILAIASKYDIPVIEDAAEALGSHINNKMCGSFGKVGILSFNGNKIITTSGGGALLTNNESLANNARFLATQARDAAPHYQHSHIGYNYRLSNVLAGIGRGQMQILPERIKQRRSNFDFYKNQFAANEGITLLEEPQGYFSNRWLTTILVNPNKSGGLTRETIRLALEAENIESRPLWKPMHLQPVFEKFPYFGADISETLFEQGLCLPSGSNLTSDDKNRIALVLNKIRP
jgi:dTDP-4-amino-4,6-dideoxygalactose transaminase